MIAKLVKASFCFAAAYCGRELIGMGRAISDGVSDAYIQDVVVASKYRGRKVGRRLVQKLLDHLLDQGIGWIGLIAQPGTETFYRNLGFRRLAGHVAMRYRH
jgi:spermidine synthase